MNKSERVFSEWEVVSDTEFWQMFVSALAEYRRVLSRRCETFPPDKILRVQGEISAIDRVIKMPEEILGSLRETVNEEVI